MNFKFAIVKVLKDRDLGNKILKKGTKVTVSQAMAVNNVRKKFPKFDPEKHLVLWHGPTYVDKQKYYDIDNPIRRTENL